MIERSIKTSILFTMISVFGLAFIKSPLALKIAVFLPYLMIPIQFFEIFKHESKSGWDQFLFMLPVSKNQIIQSKYITFLLLLLVSLLISLFSLFLVNNFIYPVPTNIFFNFALRGLGIISCMAALIFPVTYLFGTQKSDSIILSSLGFSFGIFLSLSIIIEIILNEHNRADEIFSLAFYLLSTFLLLLSYFITCFIYSKKEYYFDK